MRRELAARLLAGCAAALCAACATPRDRPIAPEASSAFRVGLASATASKPHGGVGQSAGHRSGTRDPARRRKSAVDAAIAIQMVLTLVEPQSAGIGGGAFLLHWDGRTVAAATTAAKPRHAAADEKLFLLPDGKPMAFYQAVVGGRRVGTPGVLRMLALAHQQHGKLPWAQLFEPAIRLAETGFALSPRLDMHAGEREVPRVGCRQPRAYFLPGRWRAEGRRHASAQSGARRDAARDRARRRRCFLSWADRRGHRQGGAGPRQRRPTGARDLRGLQVKERPAAVQRLQALARLRHGHRRPRARSRSRRCSASSSHRNIAVVPPQGLTAMACSRQPTRSTCSAEAGRLAFADRNLYVADPDFVAVERRASARPGLPEVACRADRRSQHGPCQAGR